MNGIAFTGKAVVGLSYFLEILNADLARVAVTLYLLSEPLFLVFIVFWYQFIDPGWFLL